MTGPEHYREAERLVFMLANGEPHPFMQVETIAGAAQVHATLALAAATAPRPPSVDLRNEWISAIYLPAEES